MIADTADTPQSAGRFRVAADSRWRRWPAALWARRGVRWLLGFAALGLLALAVLWVIITRNLPSAATLLTYEPPLPSYVRSINGEPVSVYARDRRVELDYSEYPPLLIDAFLAAEDRTFFEHGGLDYAGIASAVLTNLRNDGRPIGASTITQQVAKNLLLTNELSYIRKLKEAVLAKRIEATLTKQQILELYLNSIALGRQSFGVEAASQAYFGVGVVDLSLSQAAFLAILPKAPEIYGRAVNVDAAIARRNFVLNEMARNGFVTVSAAAVAQAEPLGLIASRPLSYPPIAGYFVEEIRRQLKDRFGETATEGPYSVYGGGLWVRSSLNPEYQKAAETSLRASLDGYGGRSWDAPLTQVEVGDDWLAALRGSGAGTNVPGWVTGVVLSKSGSTARVGLPDGSTGTLPSWGATLPVRGKGGTAFATIRPGNVVLLAKNGDNWLLRALPSLSGALVVENPHTGQVLAMQGGYDQRTQSFNRATQALRQPGSTIKPFVYATALDNGMTPATQIVDAPFCVYQGANLGQKCFRNFSGGNAGAQTMRWGLEQSRNLMTVRAASQSGMENVVKTISRMGIGDYKPYLSVALGAGETTVGRMTNAFSMLANNGRQLTPTLYDLVQDRHGKVIPGTRADTRLAQCARCNAPDWDGKPMPRLPARGKQLLDAVTAYQVVHMLEGVVTRGTAQRLADLDRPLFGKTGTTNGPKEVWFVGGTPDVVAGVYLGYDRPRVMNGAQGGRLAAPVVKSFLMATQADAPRTPFRISEGTRMVRIDRRSGRRVFSAWPGDDPKAAVIWEAFKPETEPTRTIRQEEIDRADAASRQFATRSHKPAPSAPRPDVADKPRSRDSEFLENTGGIY